MKFIPKEPTRPNFFHLKLQLFSILLQKEFLKCINSEGSNGSLSIQKHKSSITFSFIFIHSVMSENDKKGTVNRLFVTFSRNELYGTHLVFFRRGDFKVVYLKF